MIDEITQSAFNKFWKTYGSGVIFLFIGITLSIIFILISELFNDESLPQKIFIKLAEASMFIGGAALIGSVYIFINEFRNKKYFDKFEHCNNISFNDTHKIFKKKIFYELE